MLHVVFVDVGGTLWPNTWPSLPGDDEERATRLHRAVPSLEPNQATAVIAALSTIDHPPTQRQQTELLVRQAIRRVVPGLHPSVKQVIDAMCLPARGRVVPFPAVGELLGGLAGRAVRVVVVSNVLWRDSRAQRRDFEDLGLSDYVADYITSLDVGWRKPHAAFFAAALRAGGYPAVDCAMVGDSEANDIEPARARGMLAIRVAIEEPLPTTSAANHVTDSLAQVTELLLEQSANPSMEP